MIIISAEEKMRKNFGAKEWLYPMPVFIVATYDKDGNPDAMNAAWGGIADTKQVFLCLSPEHKTVKNILEKKAFTVSPATAQYTAECDYVGIVSGNNEPEKLKKAGFHIEKSAFVDAPLISELPFALECNLISYDEKTSRLIGEIVNVSADETIISEDGKIDVKKLNPITYDSVNHDYITLGEIVGKAFGDGNKIKSKA